MSRRFVLLALVSLLVLVACDSATPEIPTVVSLDALATEQAATREALASPTLVAPTLPPTWTPSPVPSPTPATATPTPETEADLSSDRLVFVAGGVIYAVAPDGSDLTALTEAMDAHDLALSPEGRRVAFVGGGLGSGREIFVVDMDSGIIQQSTALGYADVADPSWHPRGTFVLFAASQYEGTQRELYTVRPDGQELNPVSSFAALAAEQPPDEVEEEAEAGMEAEIMPLTEPLFTPNGQQIVFAMPELRMLDLATGEMTTVTIGTGWGNDANLAWRPGAGNTLFYIRPRGEVNGQSSGPLHMVGLDNFTPLTIPPIYMEMYAETFAWSVDGAQMVFASGERVHLLDARSQSARLVAETGGISPHVAISPDGTRIAYTWGNGAQIAVFRLGDREGQEIVHLPGQEIGDIVWAAGE